MIDIGLILVLLTTGAGAAVIIFAAWWCAQKQIESEEKHEKSLSKGSVRDIPNLGMHDIDMWPLTIIADRYSGSYSGAQFLAFNKDHCDMPEEVGGVDGEEANFWIYEETYKQYIIGKGDTPQEAYIDLYNKIKDLCHAKEIKS